MGRDEELNELWRILERDNVLLMAPRRYGKTSHMYAMLDEPQPGWKVVLVDVEYIDDPAEFLTTLTAELLRIQPVRNHLLSKVSSLPGSLSAWFGSLTQDLAVKVLDVAELKLRLRDQLEHPESWPELAAQFIAQLGGLDEDLSIILDEFPVMIANLLDRNRGPGAAVPQVVPGDEAEAVRQGPDPTNGSCGFCSAVPSTSCPGSRPWPQNRCSTTCDSSTCARCPKTERSRWFERCSTERSGSAKTVSREPSSR